MQLLNVCKLLQCCEGIWDNKVEKLEVIKNAHKQMSALSD